MFGSSGDETKILERLTSETRMTLPLRHQRERSRALFVFHTNEHTAFNRRGGLYSLRWNHEDSDGHQTHEEQFATRQNKTLKHVFGENCV